MPNTFKNYASASVTTQTTVYTAPSATQSTIIGMTVANTANATANISVQVTMGATTVFVVKNAPIPVGGALVPIGGDQKVVLEAADAIKVTSDQTVDVLLSVLEIS